MKAKRSQGVWEENNSRQKGILLTVECRRKKKEKVIRKEVFKQLKWEERADMEEESRQGSIREGAADRAKRDIN